VGDEVEVYVISFDREKNKISLGYKKDDDNPWVQFTKKYEIGDTAA
jgi:4-hydroxy-3-methylbut-2-enyl diphosphate reductase